MDDKVMFSTLRCKNNHVHVSELARQIVRDVLNGTVGFAMGRRRAWTGMQMARVEYRNYFKEAYGLISQEESEVKSKQK